MEFFLQRLLAGVAVNPSLAVTLKVLSALAFTLMSAGIKLVSDRVPVGEIVFFRSFFMLIPLMLWLAWQGQVRSALRTRNVIGHFRRGLMSSSSMFLNFLALAYLPLTDAIAFGYTAPLLVVLLAALMLGEKVQSYRWLGTGVGFIGVLIMLAPQLSFSTMLAGGAASVGIMIALAGALTTAFALIQVRRLVDTETTGSIIFYLAVMTSALSLLTIIGGWVVPTVEEAAIMIAIGILGGLGQILLTMSFRYGDASLLAPFEYSTMLWACLIGWFVFGDWPLPAVFIGAGIVVVSSLVVLWREHLEMQARHQAKLRLTAEENLQAQAIAPVPVAAATPPNAAGL